jgi:hypothetical protein
VQTSQSASKRSKGFNADKGLACMTGRRQSALAHADFVQKKLSGILFLFHRFRHPDGNDFPADADGSFCRDLNRHDRLTLAYLLDSATSLELYAERCRAQWANLQGGGDEAQPRPTLYRFKGGKASTFFPWGAKKAGRRLPLSILSRFPFTDRRGCRESIL